MCSVALLVARVFGSPGQEKAAKVSRELSLSAIGFLLSLLLLRAFFSPHSCLT